MRIYFILFLTFTISSCAMYTPKMQYIGNENNYTNNNIELHLAEWFDANNNPELMPMGKFYVYGNWANIERLQKKMKKKAQKMGADVIVVDLPVWRSSNTASIQFNYNGHLHQYNQYYEAHVYKRKPEITNASGYVFGRD